MNDGTELASERERRLVDLYMEVTGASESSARNVFMQVCCNQSVEDVGGQDIGGEDGRNEQPIQVTFAREFPYATKRLRAATLVAAPA